MQLSGGTELAACLAGEVKRAAVLRDQTSWEKCLITMRIGFGAACPRPQMDASTMAVDNSSSSGLSH